MRKLLLILIVFSSVACNNTTDDDLRYQDDNPNAQSVGLFAIRGKLNTRWSNEIYCRAYKFYNGSDSAYFIKDVKRDSVNSSGDYVYAPGSDVPIQIVQNPLRITLVQEIKQIH